MPLSRITSASIANSAISAADIADGTITAAKIISVANTQITGNIVSSQITSVANTQLTGTITGSQISSNTLSNTVFQTGSVENYMSAQGTSFGMRNKIINGAMVIDQRNAGAAITGTASLLYSVDRFNTFVSTDGVMTFQQVADAPTGFTYSLKATTTTADASLTATQRAILFQRIEGYNVSDLMLGSANAVQFTASFWVKSTLTGTFGGSFQNTGSARAYPFTYTISVASTWEQKTVTITGDTTGTWDTTNGSGLQIVWGLGVGSTFSGTAGAWAAGDFNSATGATSVIGTLNATWQVTGVQLEKGSKSTPFENRPYGTEFNLCQRYYWRNSVTEAYGWFGLGTCTSATNARINIALGQTMRTTPTVFAGGNTRVYDGGAAVGASSFSINNNSLVYPQLTVTTNSGLTQGRAAFLGADNNAATYLAFDAEL
jgi:hypothetical protein